MNGCQIITEIDFKLDLKVLSFAKLNLFLFYWLNIKNIKDSTI